MFLTTALFNQLVDRSPAIFASLRCLLFGGEAVDPDRVRSVLAPRSTRTSAACLWTDRKHNLFHVF